MFDLFGVGILLWPYMFLSHEERRKRARKRFDNRKKGDLEHFPLKAIEVFLEQKQTKWGAFFLALGFILHIVALLTVLKLEILPPFPIV